MKVKALEDVFCSDMVLRKAGTVWDFDGEIGGPIVPVESAEAKVPQKSAAESMKAGMLAANPTATETKASKQGIVK